MSPASGPQRNEDDFSASTQSAFPNDPIHVLTIEEIANLAAEGGKPAETLTNVTALIAKRFKTDVCSAYLLEPDRANLILAATLGLRQSCVGTLRMALHEGLAGSMVELVALGHDVGLRGGQPHQLGIQRHRRQIIIGAVAGNHRGRRGSVKDGAGRGKIAVEARLGFRHRVGAGAGRQREQSDDQRA